MKKTSQQKSFLLLLLLLSVVLFSGCADNESVEQCLTGYKYGFFGGLWHGFIAPFDFIGMLFSKDITMYAQNNNGGLYALGFLMGSGGWGFFGSKGASKVRSGRFHFRNDKFDRAEIVD